jgi:hypothetical protein
MTWDMLKALILVLAAINCLAVRRVYATGIKARARTNYTNLHHRHAREFGVLTFAIFLVAVELMRAFGPPLPPYLEYLYKAHICAAAAFVVVAVYIFLVKNGNLAGKSHYKWVWYVFTPLYAFMMLSGAALVILR